MDVCEQAHQSDSVAQYTTNFLGFSETYGWFSFVVQPLVVQVVSPSHSWRSGWWIGFKFDEPIFLHLPSSCVKFLPNPQYGAGTRIWQIWDRWHRLSHNILNYCHLYATNRNYIVYNRIFKPTRNQSDAIGYVAIGVLWLVPDLPDRWGCTRGQRKYTSRYVSLMPFVCKIAFCA
jgi:hypothetical protein